jgi:hypothetical protein
MAAVSSIKAAIRDAWASALGSDEFGLDDNFFDVGGTSVLLIAVRARLQARLEREIAVAWMFECTTVRTLTARLEGPDHATAMAGETHRISDNARKQREAFARARAARSGAQV